MLKHRYLLLILAVVIIGNSCTKEATIKLPPAEDKLVVTSFISPDDTMINVTVRTSKPKYNSGWMGPNYQNIQDAQVLLSDGTTNITLPYISNLDCYAAPASDFPILAGRSYYLTVTTPDGKNATASTSVPIDKLQVNEFNADITQSDSVSLDFRASVLVNDIPEVTYVFASFEYISSQLSDDPPLYSEAYGQSTRFFDSDEHSSKSQYIFSAQSSLHTAFSNNIRYAGVFISVLNCDRHFYLYNKSVENNMNGGGDNPFADPSLVYTNVTNGFGCFGAFRKNTVLKRIR